MNTNTIIRTPADHAAALAEIDSFGDPEIGTADFERLDRLVTQVEEYEDEHSPMGTPTAEAVAEYEAEKRDADRATRLTAAEHAEYTRLLSEMGILADLEILDERERQAELERGVATTTEQSTYT